MAMRRTMTRIMGRTRIMAAKKKRKGAKVKSKRQVGYLLSGGSPLTGVQKGKLKRELHSGAVKVKV